MNIKVLTRTELALYYWWLVTTLQLAKAQSVRFELMARFNDDAANDGFVRTKEQLGRETSAWLNKHK